VTIHWSSGDTAEGRSELELIEGIEVIAGPAELGEQTDRSTICDTS